MDYAAAAERAKSAVQKNGMLVEFYKSSGTPADVGLPWRGPNVETVTQTVPAIVLSPSSTDLGITISDPELVRTASYVLLTGPFQDAETFEYVTLGATIYRIVQIDTLKPADVALLHYMWVAG